MSPREKLRFGLLMLACLVFTLGFVAIGVDSVQPFRPGDLLLSVAGVLFFGGGGWAGVVANRRDLQVERETARIRERVGPVERHDLDRVRELVREMRAAPAGRARVELADLGGCPGLLDALIFHGGRGELPSWPRGEVATPLDVVLDSLDRDGRVREAAVRVMAAEPLDGQEWFLVERAVDHVAGIRAGAIEAIEALLAADPERGLVVRRAFGRVAGRERAGELRELLDRRDCGDGGDARCCTYWVRQPIGERAYLMAQRGPCWYARRERVRRESEGTAGLLEA
ncbi:hypothetical protein [Actinoplanes sp. HUAS TT8]|uniref:hypothetical protein n=1 Tax=Actinoplanes sp. HUAS TT8 TaxID=3447453 RepID=UPI003F529039